MRTVMLAVLILIGGIVMSQSNPPSVAAADKPAKLLRHIVLYKFYDGLHADRVRELIDAFAALPDKIDTIVSLEHGENVSQEGKSEGLTYGFVVTFKSQADLDAYIKHPAHQEYVKIAKDRREKAVVFDFWTSAPAG